MITISDVELIRKAQSVLNPRRIRHGMSFGDVGCALVSENGNVYMGVCVDTGSGMGFCAEHGAVAAMITGGELVIRKIVAVAEGGRPIPPCGRCREFISQIHERNMEAEVIIAPDRKVKLKDLLPYPWDAEIKDDVRG